VKAEKKSPQKQEKAKKKQVENVKKMRVDQAMEVDEKQEKQEPEAIAPDEQKPEKKRKADHPSRVRGEHIFQKRFGDDHNSNTSNNNNNNSSDNALARSEEEGLEKGTVKRTKRDEDLHASIFSSSSFENFDLEPRLLKALTGMAFFLFIVCFLI
jgi:hypothetical protein